MEQITYGALAALLPVTILLSNGLCAAYAWNSIKILEKGKGKNVAVVSVKNYLEQIHNATGIEKILSTLFSQGPKFVCNRYARANQE